MMDHQLSSPVELGSLQKAYRDQGMWIGFFVFVAIMILLSIFVILASLENSWYLSFFIPMSLLVAIVPFWVLRLDKRSIRISVYEKGFVYQKFYDHKVIFWSDIWYIRYTVLINYGADDASGPRYTYSFYEKNGETLLTLKFDGAWQNQKRKIVEMIEQATSTLLSPPILEAYQQGEECSFRGITLSRQGVSYSGKTLPWSEVKSFVIGIDTIQIKRYGDRFLKKWLNARLEYFDNVVVMRKLIAVAASTYHFQTQNHPKHKIKQVTE